MSDAYDDAVSHIVAEKIRLTEQIDTYEKYASSDARNSIWTTKDLSAIRLSDMSSDHLRNTIKFLKRKYGTHPAIKLMEFELSYREDYPKILEEAEEVDNIMFKCL